jgi:hypothetical protein
MAATPPINHTPMVIMIKIAASRLMLNAASRRGAAS